MTGTDSILKPSTGTPWLDLAAVVLINAVPLVGVLYFGWSGVVVIVLYWAENALGTLFTAARIALHRRLTHKRGHWRAGQLDNQRVSSSSTLLADYVFSSILSAVLQGIFVALFAAFAVVVLTAQHDDWHTERVFSVSQLVHGMESLLIAMALSFAVDMCTIKQRSFLWLKTYVVQKHERWMLLFFAMLLGFFVMIPTQSPLAVAYLLIAINTAAGIFQSITLRKAQDIPLAIRLTAQAEAADRAQRGKGVSAAQRRQIEALVKSAAEDELVQT